MKIKYGSGLGIFRESGMLKCPPPLPSHRDGNIIRYAWFGTLMCDKSGTQCRQCCRSCRWGSCHCPSTWLGCRFVCGCLRCVVCWYWCLCYFGRGKDFLLVLFDGTIAVPPRKWQNKTDRTVMLSSMMYAVAKLTCYCSEPVIVAACTIIFNWIICPKKFDSQYLPFNDHNKVSPGSTFIELSLTFLHPLHHYRLSFRLQETAGTGNKGKLFKHF